MATAAEATCLRWGHGMSNESPDRKREYVLAELRCAWIKARLAQIEIETAAVAFKHNIVTSEEAAAMLSDSDVVRFVGIEVYGGAE